MAASVKSSTFPRWTFRCIIIIPIFNDIIWIYWPFSKFEKNLQDFVGVLQPATVLKMTGCFLVISEGVVSMCLKNNIYRKFIGKTLPISKTLPLPWLIHDKTTHTTNKLFSVIPLFNKKLHNNSFLQWLEKQPFSRAFEHFLKLITINPGGTFFSKWYVLEYSCCWN